MTFLSIRVAGAVLAGSLLCAANALGIDTVTSSVDTDGGDGIVSSAVGGVLTIDGLGFGTAKPKVFLLDEATGKKYVLKVTAFDDDQITAEIKKAVMGELQLNVQPKGADPFTFDSVVIERPDVGGLFDETFQDEIDEASPGLAFYISGEYLGSKKGKILIGGKKAKVLTWAMTGILLEMPKKLANGLWDILLDNKVGTDDEHEITMFGSTVKIGKAKFNFFVNGNKVDLKYGAGAAPGGYGVVAVGTSGTNPSKSAVVAVPFFDGNDFPEDYVFGTDLFVVSYIETGKFVLGGPPPTVNAWTPTVGFTVNITANSAGQAAGNFEGILESQTAADIAVSGDFVVDVILN
jgi:hypothetical protein